MGDDALRSQRSDVSERASPSRSRSTLDDNLDKLLEQNRKWAEERQAVDPEYFNRLLAQQAPEYLWIGCADSRVPANVILGLEPGEVFTQRNVGNQATHTDMNVMACLEYAVTELKVKTIICCGHYGCGAVKAALRLPSKTQGLVNCWISDIRECRNQHHAELKALGSTTEQVDRLCELNVLRQTFHVCTSPVVQNAWDQGQELAVYGLIYNLKDGLIQKLVGPLTKDNACFDILEYEHKINDLNRPRPQPCSPSVDLNNLDLKAMDVKPCNQCEQCVPPSRSSSTLDSEGGEEARLSRQDQDTMALASRVAQHVGWSGAEPAGAH